jgi:predicted aspartyl protease
MRRLMIALILSLVLIPGLAPAEIYYWVDNQGNQQFTTNYESIPERYRGSVSLLPYSKGPAPSPEPPAPSSTGSARISFTPGSPVLVSARINGVGPVTLIFDTGADRTLIAPSVLTKLGISTENAPRAAIKGVTGTSYGNAVWIESVEVGGAKAGPILVIAYDAELKGADGLLGRDFMGNFHVTIDSKEQVVIIAPN